MSKFANKFQGEYAPFDVLEISIIHKKIVSYTDV